MFDQYIHEYIFSGSLPENASTYVTRSADGELYAGLKEGKFCYVLNTRQSGKSSLRVRTMQRLRKDGVECAAIDLSAGGIQNVPPEQWYADLIDTLIESFGLDLDFGDWWSANQELTLVTRFRKFIERILLAEIKDNIVIFIDEIDSVLSLNFPTDDFFAFIRACYNQRVDNPAYKRLTFCLLGVASPSNLIEDKQRTPFNIGKAISLKGFQLNEVEPLIRGLQGKFSEPQAVMQEILDWTGGQPFLTQKLCQFMVEESTAARKSKVKGQKSKKDNSPSVEEVVRARIIENWESQDEPEHLRTIRARIFRNEERAGYLLELYQQIRGSQEEDEITADNTIEQSELLLSGLIAKREGKLRVYNRIYQEVFNQSWVENELKNLRPYSEAFRAWVASGNQDESRLLRGNALVDAEEWAKDKNLSYQDKQFLAASREKEIQEKIAVEEQKARLERERKDREAAEQRNKVLSEANRKAQRRISIGSIILLVTLLGAIASVIVGVKQVETANKRVEAADKQVKEATSKLEKAEEQAKIAHENEEKATKSAEQAKQQEKLAKSNERLAQEQVEQAKRQEKIAKNNEFKAQQSALKFEKNAQTAKEELAGSNQKLTLAEDKEKRIQAQLKQIESKLVKNSRKNEEIRITVERVQNLSKLAGELRNQNLTAASDEALRQAGLSFSVSNHNLKQAILLASMSQAYQKFNKPDEAKKKITESLKFLKKGNKINSDEGLQIQVLLKRTEGNLFADKKYQQQAIKAYQEAYNILKNNPSKTNPFKNNQILTVQDIEFVHRVLLDLIKNQNQSDFRQEVWDSLKQHFYAKLQNFLSMENWVEANIITSRLILFIAERKKEGTLDSLQIKKFPCPDLKQMDDLWRQNSGERIKFSDWMNLEFELHPVDAVILFHQRLAKCNI